MTKPTIKMLNENMRTHRALNNNTHHNAQTAMEEEVKGADEIIEEVVNMEGLDNNSKCSHDCSKEGGSSDNVDTMPGL